MGKVSQLQTPPWLTLSGKAEATEKALCAAVAPAERRSDETFSSSRSASVDASGSEARCTSVAFGKQRSAKSGARGLGSFPTGQCRVKTQTEAPASSAGGLTRSLLSCGGLMAPETGPPERGCHGAREAEQFSSAAAVWTAEENARAALGKGGRQQSRPRPESQGGGPGGSGAQRHSGAGHGALRLPTAGRGLWRRR